MLAVPAEEQGEGVCRKAPVGSRNGPSNSTLFQIAFSQNKPIPPRIEVLPFWLDPTQNQPAGKVRIRLVTGFAKPRDQTY